MLNSEKIKSAVGEIFSEHNNQALSFDKLVELAGQKLRNGEIDEELIQIIINMMIDEFELMPMPNGKVVPYSFP